MPWLAVTGGFLLFAVPDSLLLAPDNYRTDTDPGNWTLDTITVVWELMLVVMRRGT